RNHYYHSQVAELCAFLIPAQSKVVEIGCSTGGLLASLQPSQGLGVDISSRCISIAQAKYPGLNFQVDDAEDLLTHDSFDYVVLSDLVGYLFDIWKAFRNLHPVTHPGTG